MAVKQISFSPELLDTPEVNDINFSDQCDLTSKTDLSQIDFHKALSQKGGNSVEEPNPVPKDPMPEIIDPGLKKVDFGQMGGNIDSVNFENMENEVSMDEITNNQDNPGEDPEQVDDAIDENDRKYEAETGNSIRDKLNQIRKIEMEMKSDENQSLMKELESTKVSSDFNFDIDKLNDTLAQEMQLYWNKNLDDAYVEKKVDEYIENYESKEYETYRKMLMYVLSKTKSGYKISINKKGEYILHRGDEERYDIKLTPPKYIDLKRAKIKIKKEIVETEFILYDLKSELLQNADKIMEEDLNLFKTTQKKYYDLKHKEAIYEAYYKKINNKQDDEIDMFLNFIKKKNNSKNDTIYAIDTKYVKASNSFQDDIRQAKISSLELFNQIRNKYEKHTKSNTKMTKEEQKEMKILIKKYLSTGNTSIILRMIEQFHNKYKRLINIIIEKKPVIDVTKQKKQTKKVPKKK